MLLLLLLLIVRFLPLLSMHILENGSDYTRILSRWRKTGEKETQTLTPQQQLERTAGAPDAMHRPCSPITTALATTRKGTRSVGCRWPG